MATLTRFNSFTKALAEKKFNLSADTLKVMLTNVAPVVTNAVKADLTEISAGNGYTAGGATLANPSGTTSGGVYKLVVDDATITCTSGTIGPYRYAVIYDDTATNKDLIAFADYGSSQTLNPGESFTTDFDQTNGLITI